jgi:predicted MFS family arabinose efflux permease
MLPSWLKRFAAALGGFVTMSIVVLLGSVLVMWALGEEPDESFAPGLEHYALNIVITAGAAWGGSRVTVLLARSSPVSALALLGAIMVAMSIVTLVAGHGELEVPPQWTLIELAVGLAVVAGVARATRRRRGS